MARKVPDYQPTDAPFPWRILVYSVLLAYLLLDLTVLSGPVRGWIDRQFRREPLEKRAERLDYVAVVNTVPITGPQLERAAREYLARNGSTLEDLSPSLRRAVLAATLGKLQRSRMVSRFAFFGEARADETVFEERIAELGATHPDGAAALWGRVDELGLTRMQFERQLRKKVAQESWIEDEIAEILFVPEEEIRAWFEAHRSEMEIPERIRASHLFLTTVDPKRPDAEARIRALHRRLQDGADFATLVAEQSDDPRSKKKGGDLGWFSRHRIPAAFAEAVFAQPVGEIGVPFQSSIGWHVARVDERQPARLPEFAEVETEIRSLLEQRRREEGIRQLLEQMEAKTIIVEFPEVFEAYLQKLETRIAAQRAE